MIPYEKFIDKIKNIKSNEHYLKKISSNYDDYTQGLYLALNNLCNSIGEKKTLKFIDEKLQFDTRNFDQAQYIQSACELSVMSDFLNNDDLKFEYEKKITPPTDVDFAIIKDEVNYNVEIKCSSYENKIEKTEDQILVIFTNRDPKGLENKKTLIKDFSIPLSPFKKEIIEEKNMDNTLKDFLLSMQSKVKNSSSDNVNILVICCDDEVDMQKWRGYLWAHGGYFTKKSIINHNEFNRVDYILMTNLFNRHSKYYADTAVNHHWKLSQSFCLLYPNHFSSRNSVIENGRNDVSKISTIFPNLSMEFEDYMADKNNLPEGENINTKNIRNYSA